MCTTCRSPRKRPTTRSTEARPPSRCRRSAFTRARPAVRFPAPASGVAAAWRTTKMHDKILIIDFGSQVTQLIARRVREMQVFCEIHPYDAAEETLKAWIDEKSLRGVILSGGPNSVTEAETPRAPHQVFEAGVPVLGICYGMQTMAEQLGGAVD